jgi:hypothetical protein
MQPPAPQQEVEEVPHAVSNAVLFSFFSSEMLFQGPDVDSFSPLQGYRVLITNLHNLVTQDDIVVKYLR